MKQAFVSIADIGRWAELISRRKSGGEKESVSGPGRPTDKAWGNLISGLAFMYMAYFGRSIAVSTGIDGARRGPCVRFCKAAADRIDHSGRSAGAIAEAIRTIPWKEEWGKFVGSR